MYRQLVFEKPPTLDKVNISEVFGLQEVLNNERTCVLENEELAVSIDKMVVRVFLYNGTNRRLQNTIEEYFYGKDEIGRTS